MGEGSRRWLKGCAIGCGSLALVLLLVVAAVGVRTCVPLRGAKRTMARLEARFGPAGSFVPFPDGAIPPGRLDAFLAVRSALSDTCPRFEAFLRRMERMEHLDETATSGREIAEMSRGFARAAAGIAPLIGKFFEGRNGALLEAEMGLGEYTYIFALAYRDRLLDESFRRELFSEGGPIGPEASEALRGMLATLDAEAGAEAEIRRMERDPRRLPWQDGLPAAVESSLLTYRERLDRAFCSATAGIELDPDSRRAMFIALY